MYLQYRIKYMQNKMIQIAVILLAFIITVGYYILIVGNPWIPVGILLIFVLGAVLFFLSEIYKSVKSIESKIESGE